MTPDQKIILIVRFLTLADEYAFKRQLNGEDIKFIKVIIKRTAQNIKPKYAIIDDEPDSVHIIADKDYYAIEPLIKEFIKLNAVEVEEL